MSTDSTIRARDIKWRRVPESNRTRRICNPLHNRFANAPLIPKHPLLPMLLIWSGKRDSNSRPRPWQGRALPTELFPLTLVFNLPFGNLKTMFWYGAAFKFWSGKRDSNSRPRPWQGRALPTELFPRYYFFAIFRWRRNLHFCVVTGGALYENAIHLQPPGEHFFSFFV